MKPQPLGLFWEVTPRDDSVRTPPERTWEASDYLPYLDEARAFNLPIMSINDLIQAQQNRETLLVDVETYMNYFLAAFRSLETGKVFYLERRASDTWFDAPRLLWIMQNFKTVGFNSLSYDIPIITLAIAGKTTEELKFSSDSIIVREMKPWLVLRSAKVQQLQVDHIDLIEVAPLKGSLKIYGGRLHVPKMQELPFKPDLILSEDQITCVRWYCIDSDLTATAFLYLELKEQISLRESMSFKYGLDLRSKSDAQIAEAVIVSELRKEGVEAVRPEIAAGTCFKYVPPDYIRFNDSALINALNVVTSANFYIDEEGSPIIPAELKDLKVKIGDLEFQMGIGGLHSCENGVSYFSTDDTLIKDVDFESFYPKIILTLGLFPTHLGSGFLNVYNSIVERRLAAKKSGNKVEADSLKITINGSFGKFGSKYSVLYAPDLMLKVTLTGQLILLALVEILHNHNIPVVSGNTDGIVIKCPVSKLETMKSCVAQWEQKTGFRTEETQYKGIYLCDVNSYVAIKEKGGVKTKGRYGDGGASQLSKNPTGTICLDALTAFLTEGTPISTTIRACKDIRRFLSVRTVKGGAVKEWEHKASEYLGKAIRWYQSTDVRGNIVYAITGNKVPNSENCRPCMELPLELPKDIDYDRYERQTLEMLKELGFK